MRRDVALALLGITEEHPSEERISKAYRAAIQMNHPDRYATNEQLRKHAEEQCKLINEAREVLVSGSWDDDDTPPPRQKPEQSDNFSRQAASSVKADHGDEDDEDNEEDSGRDASPKPSEAYSPPHPPIWHQYKDYLLGVAILIALVVMWMIPAEIPVPARTLSDLRDGGQVVRITYLDGEKGVCVFRVSADPEDFTVIASVELPEDLKPGTKGYLGTRHGNLKLDGSYQYRYDFMFPREGNLLQSLLTRFGIWNFNYPCEGHIDSSEIAEESVYRNEEEGFSALFPGYPTKEEYNETIDGVATTALSFDGSRGSEFTVVDVIKLGALMETIQSGTFEQKQAFAANSLGSSLMRYENLLKPTSSEYEPTYSEINGYPCATTIVPFVYQAEDGTEGSSVYCYALCLITDTKVYSLLGARYTLDDAQEALASFALI